MVDESRQPGRPGATNTPIGTRARNRTIVMDSRKATAFITGEGAHESQPEGNEERRDGTPERPGLNERRSSEKIDPPLSKSQDDSYKALEEILEIASQGSQLPPRMERENTTDEMDTEDPGASEPPKRDSGFDSSWFTAKRTSARSTILSGEPTDEDLCNVTRETDRSKPTLDSESEPRVPSKNKVGGLPRLQRDETAEDLDSVLHEVTPSDAVSEKKSVLSHLSEKVGFERIAESKAGHNIDAEEVYWQSETPLIGFLVSYDRNPNGTFVALRAGRLIVSSRREASGSCLVLRDDSVSPMHAIMRESSDGGLQVIDQLSEAGTRICRSGCEEDIHLSGERGEAYHGDKIFFGDRSFEVVLISRAEK